MLILINSFRLLAYLSPITLLLTPNPGIFILSMLLISIVWIFTNKNFQFDLDKSDLFLISSFIFYFLIQLVYIFWFDSNLRELDTPSRFIMVLPIFLMAKKVLLNFNFFKYSLVIASFLGGIFGIYQYLIANTNIQGFIDQGTFALVLSIFTSFTFYQAIISKDIRKKIIYLLVVIIGSASIIFSGIRQVWIIYLLVNFVILISQNQISKKRAMTFTLLFLVIVYNFFPNIKTEFHTLINNWVEYMDEKRFNTSVAERGEIYKANILIIQEYPFGIGENNFSKYKNKLISENKINKEIINNNNMHSEIFASLVEQGVFGLISFILVVLIPYLFFKKNYNNNEAALFGMIFISHFMLFAIASGIFDYQVSTLIYTYLTVIIYSFSESLTNVRS